MLKLDEIEGLRGDMTAWRHDLHQHPELAFQEKRTAGLVASELRSFGLTVVEGIAQTGVVAVLDCGAGPSFGLRADMDALKIQEATGLSYQSVNHGVMHACGHDGHTAMLLGAARYLAQHPPARGRIHFVFQPAEEVEGGAKAMIDDGLFTKFPMQAIFGLHNHPGLAAGKFATAAGPLMAAFDTFHIELRGRGCHAAMPETGIDPILAGATLVQSLQALVTREIASTSPLALSVTKFHAGAALNVCPDTALIEGSVRYFDPAVGEHVKERLASIASGIAQAGRASAVCEYRSLYPPLINHSRETEIAVAAAQALVGPDEVDPALDRAMGSEDFAYFLREMPGNYMLLGNALAGDTGDSVPCVLHSPTYDFNDAILTTGAAYWASLAHAMTGQAE